MALTLWVPHRPLGALAEDRTEQVRRLPYDPQQYTLCIKDKGQMRECWGGVAGRWMGWRQPRVEASTGDGRGSWVGTAAARSGPAESGGSVWGQRKAAMM